MPAFLPRLGPLLLLIASAGVQAQAPAPARVEAPHVRAELLLEDRALTPDATHWVGVRLTPEPGWHVYWENPGDSGLPTEIRWSLPEGLRAGEIHWPYPHPESLGELTNYGYSEATLHLVPLHTPPQLQGPQRLQAEVKWLVCSDVCIPGGATLGLDAATATQREPDPALRSLFAEARAQLPQPWPGGALRYAIADDTLSLEMEGPWTADMQLAFFPRQNDLVAHAAPQRIAIEGERARLSQRLSDYFVEAQDPVTGVLVVSGAAGAAQAYALSASAGEVLPVAEGATGGAADPLPAPAPGLPLVLAFAFLGGLILNLMPCVFPVLSLKAMSVLRSQDQGAAHRRHHALLYTAGVVASCGLIAAALLGLRAGGEAVGWGFQLQSPVFVGLMAYVMFALGLSLSGVIHFGSSLMGVGQSLTQSQGASGSFFTGVLAVVVASPCTAPFMGTALGYALTQPPLVSLSVFVALGLGLASPFLLIGFVPGAARWLPRPGAWMETFKQLMAFPLYLTAVWLIWVAGRQAGPSAMAVLLIGLVIIAFAVWLLAKPGRWGRVAAAAAALGALLLLAQPVLGPQAAVPSGAPAEADYEAYSDARFDALRAEGRTVFVDFTADWCLSCKVNERVALKSDRVQQAFAEHDVAFLVGDWTRADPAITAVLERYGRSGVPLYLVSRQGAEPTVLPQLLTPEIVISAITP
jgi:thiol:disulfide interchange protein DsbD